MHVSSFINSFLSFVDDYLVLGHRPAPLVNGRSNPARTHGWLVKTRDDTRRRQAGSFASAVTDGRPGAGGGGGW